MKNIVKFAAAAVVAVFICSVADAQTPDYQLMAGPGIVTSVSISQSQLPKAAQTFLQTVYSRVAVGPVKHNTIKNTYNVTLGNDVKVTFNAKGQVVDIQASYPDVLFAGAVKAVLPDKVCRHLAKDGLLGKVTGIKNAGGKVLRVMFLNNMPPEMLFDVDGVFVFVND